MSKRVYTGFSFFQVLWFLFLRVMAVFLMVYVLSNYEENPPVVITISAFLFLLILIIGDDQIVVYQDRIVQKTNSIWSLVINSKGSSYQIENIKLAYLYKPTIPDPGAGLAAAALYLILPKSYRSPNGSDRSKPIFLNLKDGTIEEISTYLDESTMEHIVQTVNAIVQKNAGKNH
jgi:hypothetical protein